MRPAAVLEKVQLGQESWSEHRLDGHHILRGSWRLEQAFDIWRFLAEAPSWAFCWRSRESSDIYLGVDALLRWGSEGPAAFRDAHGLSIFGGQPFYEGDNQAPLWGELEGAQWLLPHILLQKREKDLFLSVHRLLPDGEASELSRRAVAAEAEAWCRGYRSEAAPSPAALPELPHFSLRHDIPAREAWMESVAVSVRAMRDRAFDKVVMSRAVQLQFDQKLLWVDLLRHLLSVKEEAFVFALKAPSGRVFLGRSPERILAWDQDRFAIDAIAGTRRRSRLLADDDEAGRELQESPKERLEHRLVTDTIAGILAEEGLRFAAVEEEQLLQLQHVQHMRTRLSGQWEEANRGLHLLGRLHPTPAVGGTPRAAALSFLRQHEAYDRGWFAGYIGMLHGSSGEFAIGIRSALIAQQLITLFAGAGIVAASDPQAEWWETELKMRNFLELFSPSAEKRTWRAERAESFSL